MTDDCYYSPYFEARDFVFTVRESCGPELTGSSWRVRVRIPNTHLRIACVEIDYQHYQQVTIPDGVDPDYRWAGKIAADTVREWRKANA